MRETMLKHFNTDQDSVSIYHAEAVPVGFHVTEAVAEL